VLHGKWPEGLYELASPNRELLSSRWPRRLALLRGRSDFCTRRTFPAAQLRHLIRGLRPGNWASGGPAGPLRPHEVRGDEARGPNNFPATSEKPTANGRPKTIMAIAR
jgi:hypothetical protein